MIVPAQTVLALLMFGILAMACWAAAFISGRVLTPLAYLGWGLLIVLVPLLGPFLVIYFHPGKPRRQLRQ